jgi:hypothetical protein
MKVVFANVLSVFFALSLAGASQAKTIVVGEGFQEPVALKVGSSAASFTTGEIVSVSSKYIPLCAGAGPGPVCLGMVAQTTVRLKFMLGGCVDQLGPVGFHVVENGGMAQAIVVSAIHIANDQSKIVACFAQPVQFVDLKIKGQDLDEETVSQILMFVNQPKMVLF